MIRRRWWAAVAGAAAVLGGALAVLLRPRPPEEFPLAEFVPADAVFYAGFRELSRLEALLPLLPAEEARRLREGLDSNRQHLSGGVAAYLDREGEWVFLARLTRAAALVAGGEVENGAAVFAESPEAMARHKGRKVALADEDSFRRLRSPCFFNLRPLRPGGRLRDFEAVGMEIVSADPLVVKGRAAYRGGVFRIFLEQYVRAPGRSAPDGAGPVAASLTEYFPRLWDEFVAGLGTLNRERAEREAAALSRAFLDGRGLKEFLKRVGPSWGFAVVPTPHEFPALVVWVELADEATRELLGKMLHRAAQDAREYAREKGEAPFVELAAEGTIWRVRFPDQAAFRMGEAFAPAYTLREKNRIVLSTCAAALQAPLPAAGDAHGALAVDVPGARDLLRKLAPLLADAAFRKEAEKEADLHYREMFTPAALAALKRQMPDASERDRFLTGQRAQLEARALTSLARTERYEKELAKQKARIESWTAPFERWAKASVSGRFTAEGFVFELKMTK